LVLKWLGYSKPAGTNRSLNKKQAYSTNAVCVSGKIEGHTHTHTHKNIAESDAVPEHHSRNLGLESRTGDGLP